MTARPEELRSLLDKQAFESLFIEHLGWDNPPVAARTVVFTEDGIEGKQIAAKRGVGVWRIDGVPPAAVRRRIDVAVSRHTRERLLVFVEDHEQLWLWPEQRASGTGFRLVEHRYHNGALNEGLLQRLASASFSIDEEPSLTVMDVLARVRRSFNADEVTKRFYREFKKHHDQLLDEVDGIGDATHLSWYGSVLLNRLMFIYFMQKKGFLDDDRDYLRNRLEMVRRHLGPESFYGFFRQFLLPLFHDGLGSHLHPYSDPEIAQIIGDVPYVNGGIFSPHLLETTYEINVPDRAFEEIFEFFDRYRWHLDERPSDDPNEINPDVLGYIFEQYVNQKEQGAYYTKEDVTGYMTGATVIPAVLDRLDAGEEPWILLTIDPDRYIYESVRYGSEEPLPDEIAAGVDDHDRRGSWSEKAPPSHGLPGETWWEVLDRRRYYDDLRAQLEAGEIATTDQAITANLDLRTLIDDHLRMLTPIQAVEDAYQVLRELTILDPTCGSGAFLFAALETLEDLYIALLDRASELPDGDTFTAAKEAEAHPNRSYFVLKSAVLNNLYGVDIMHEAGEIARLRLFLKLVAQLSKRDELEPLPDLDFNIRTGNLLVGIVDADDARERLGTDLLGLAQLDSVERAAEEASAAYEAFVRSQRTGLDPYETRQLKITLTETLGSLREDLDRFLYDARGESMGLEQWLESHQPFHWFIEFPQVFRRGGFDVVVGNPPYIGRTKVNRYRWTGLSTHYAPDIYAPCVERATRLAQPDGRFTMVVPHSLCFSRDFATLRNDLRNKCSRIWLSSFALMPDSLFTGVRIRNTIVVAERGAGDAGLWSGWRNRWASEARPFLFGKVRYTRITETLSAEAWPFLGSDSLGRFFENRMKAGGCFGDSLSKRRSPKTELRYKKVAGYYVSMWPRNALGDPPSVDADGKPIPSTEVASLWTSSEEALSRMFAVGIGKWFFAWWAIYGDDFHVTKGVVSSFPLSELDLPAEVSETIRLRLDDLLQGLRKSVTYKGYKYRGRSGARIANYYVPAVRLHTDVIDRALAQAIADDECWWAINVCHAHLSRLGNGRDE